MTQTDCVVNPQNHTHTLYANAKSKSYVDLCLMNQLSRRYFSETIYQAVVIFWNILLNIQCHWQTLHRISEKRKLALFNLANMLYGGIWIQIICWNTKIFDTFTTANYYLRRFWKLTSIIFIKVIDIVMALSKLFQPL